MIYSIGNDRGCYVISFSKTKWGIEEGKVFSLLDVGGGYGDVLGWI